MKIKFYAIAICLLMISSLQAQEKCKKQVLEQVAALHKAMVDADSLQLTKLTHTNLSYGHSSGAVDNKKEFVQKIVSGKSDFVTMQTSDETITVSGKTAIVRHVLDASTNDNGKPGQVHLKVLQVWKKKGRHWFLLARQAVKLT